MLPITDRFLAINEVRSVAHSLSASALGRPIGWNAAGKPVVWDDALTPPACYPIAILRSIIHADRIKISTSGTLCEVADAMLPGGMPVAGAATNSRFLFWDHSLGQYVHTAPGDAQLASEALYWIGPGDTAAHSVCLALYPNRPSLSEFYAATSGLVRFREAADKTARLNINPLRAGDLVMQLNVGITYHFDGLTWRPLGSLGSCDTLPDWTEAHVGTVLYNRGDDSFYKRSTGSWIATLP